jgi:cob(I)alamin adenosyltransferase
MAARKKSKKSKTKKATKRKVRKSSPKVTITGTIEALKGLAVDVSKIPGLIIKRAGF